MFAIPSASFGPIKILTVPVLGQLQLSFGCPNFLDFYRNLKKLHSRGIGGGGGGGGRGGGEVGGVTPVCLFVCVEA